MCKYSTLLTFIHRILLYHLALCHWWKWFGEAQQAFGQIPPGTRSIPQWRHTISLQPSSSTCLNPLPWTNQKVWHTKWAMLIHYWIKAHHRCQMTLSAFKSLQCALSNDPDGPTARATEGVCSWLSSTWHVEGFHLDRAHWSSSKHTIVKPYWWQWQWWWGNR